MMGTQLSTGAVQMGERVLAWFAEVIWSDGSGGNTPSLEWRFSERGDGEWCMGSLESASDAGTAGGDVVLSWSWTSSWR